MKNILLIVDPQNDFITGTLAVNGAKEKMMKLAECDFSKYDYIYVTMDSHPDNHASFKENNGIWPKHCVINTNGWEIPEYLKSALEATGKVSYYLKGTNPKYDEYSIFSGNEDGHNLTLQIKEFYHTEGINIDVCGIAGDYCVLETLKSLTRLVKKEVINVLTNYIASIDRGVALNDFIEKNNLRTDE